jgi:hypothetical protein
MKNDIEEKRQSGEPRILIVGGVAGGASCAARARRMSEKAEIIMFERGLPFHEQGSPTGRQKTNGIE